MRSVVRGLAILAILFVISFFAALVAAKSSNRGNSESQFMTGISAAKKLQDQGEIQQYFHKALCIPFSRIEESIFQNFSRFERYSAYRVGNAILHAPENIMNLFDLSEAKYRWYQEEIYRTPRLYELYLRELLRKEFKGEFSDEVKREIEAARRGAEYQYLAELISWMDRGMSTEEMINATLERMELVQEDRLVNSYRYGILLVMMREIHPGRYSRASYNFVPSHGSKVMENSYRAMLDEYSDQYNRMKLYLRELLRKEFKGEFSDEVKREIEAARRGAEYQYLAELISWMDRGMSTEEMINATLERMDESMSLLASSARYYGTYLMLNLISKNESYLLEYCNPPKYPPKDGTWYYIYNWAKTGRVWVGCYYSSTPDVSESPIKEFCTSTYTTDLNYYWDLAKSGYCKNKGTGQSVPGYLINSIQVKWFYSAQISGYSGFHDLIWEGNKNANSVWYTYAAYRTTSPQAGYYMFRNYMYVLQCCYSPLRLLQHALHMDVRMAELF
ncbi:MAG: hypothetical protein ACP5LQ_08020 [Candidatus Methanodesulfokora sp.]